MSRPAWKMPWWQQPWRFFRWQLPWRLKDSWYAFWHTFVMGDWCNWKWLDVPDCGCCGWGSPGWVCRKCHRFQADLGIGHDDRPRGPSGEVKSFTMPRDPVIATYNAIAKSFGMPTTPTPQTPCEVCGSTSPIEHYYHPPKPGEES